MKSNIIFFFFCLAITNVLGQTKVEKMDSKLIPKKFSKQNISIIPEFPNKDSVVIEILNSINEKVSILEPLNIGKNLVLNIDFDTIPSQTFENTTIKEIEIFSPNSNTLSLNFSQINLSRSAKLFVINDAESFVLGPITVDNVSRNIDFDPGFIPGDKIRVLLLEEHNEIEKSNLVISRVGHIVYDFFGVRKTVFEGSPNCYGFDCSSSCLENIVCFPDFNDESRAVALITYTDPLDEFNNIGIHGTGYLINNGFQDKRPLFLSMIHGIGGYMIPDLKLIFHYKSPQCNSSIEGPVAYFIQGATPLILDPSNDLRLIELQTNPGTSQIFSTNPVSYLGWSIIDEPITKTYGVHHPKGDVQKYMEGGLATPILEPGTSYGVWKYNLNNGFPETNSSGSPTFNQFKRVIGSLRSSEQELTCSNFQNIDTYSVRISKSWPVLCQFLDPGNDGIVAMNTLIDNPVDKVFSSISGPDYLCSTSSFNLINAPLDIPISWSASPAALVGISGSGSSVNLTPLGSGSVTLTATISTDCGEVKITKTVWVGTPSFTSPTVDGNPYIIGSCHGVCPGFHQAEVTIGGLTNAMPPDVNWQLSGGPVSWSWDHFTGRITFEVQPMTSFPFSFNGTATNPCGSTPFTFCFISGPNCPMGSYALSPNPADGEVVVTNQAATDEDTDQAVEISIISQSFETVYSMTAEGTKIRVPTGQLPNGQYVIQISDKNGVYRKHLIIRH